MAFATTFHDLLDPLTGERSSLRLEGGKIVARDTTLPGGGGGRDLDGSAAWVLPALYDADAHLPLVDVGLRESDRYAAMNGGVSRVNVAMQWQDIVDLDLRALVDDLTRWDLPRITPLLSVHSDQPADGFGEWLIDHLDLITELMPRACKLYSYGDGFWDNLQAVFEAGLLPIIYCKDIEDVRTVAAKAPGPVHFRHAMTSELIDLMSGLDGATLQTSPHFLLPVSDEVRSGLHVLPPVPGSDVRDEFLPRVLDEIDLIVTDHNAPPLGEQPGPGLAVLQDFVASLITAAEINDWPLADVWAKATTEPAERYGVELDDSVIVVDPDFRRTVALWPPRQSAERAPYRGLELRGRVLAIGSSTTATLF